MSTKPDIMLPRRRPYPVIGIIAVSPITDIEFIEDAFNGRAIASFILEPRSFTVLPELYASGSNIPVYFIRHTSPIYLTAIDELHVFCRSMDETPPILDTCDAADIYTEIHIIP